MPRPPSTGGSPHPCRRAICGGGREGGACGRLVDRPRRPERDRSVTAASFGPRGRTAVSVVRCGRAPATVHRLMLPVPESSRASERPGRSEKPGLQRRVHLTGLAHESDEPTTWSLPPLSRCWAAAWRHSSSGQVGVGARTSSSAHAQAVRPLQRPALETSGIGPPRPPWMQPGAGRDVAWRLPPRQAVGRRRAP